MEQSPGIEKRFWLAHVRGPFYEKLRSLGFIVFYPAMDDYVFLEVADKNKPLLNRQTELCIHFLKKREKLLTISQAEVDQIRAGTAEHVKESSRVEVVSGYCAGLDGRIVEVEDEQCKCELKGYNRSYTVWVDKLDVVYMKEDTVPL
jgi:transcription antitermination factor NusG